MTARETPPCCQVTTPAPPPGAAGGAAAAPRTAWPAGPARRPVATTPVVVTIVHTVEVEEEGRRVDYISAQMVITEDLMVRIDLLQ